MADPTVQEVVKGGNIYVVNVRKVFDTDDADFIVVDKSTLAGPLGSSVAPGKINILEIWWTVSGYNYVQLEFDRDTDNLVGSFSGQGYIDYQPYGGKIDQGSGGTGDLVLTTSGGQSGGSYNLLIKMRLKK